MRVSGLYRDKLIKDGDMYFKITDIFFKGGEHEFKI